MKGIKAQGNQLTTEKVRQINLLDPLPHEEPEDVPAEEIEVVEEEAVDGDIKNKESGNGVTLDNAEDDGDGEQTSLF